MCKDTRGMPQQEKKTLKKSMTVQLFFFYEDKENKQAKTNDKTRA